MDTELTRRKVLVATGVGATGVVGGLFLRRPGDPDDPGDENGDEQSQANGNENDNGEDGSDGLDLDDVLVIETGVIHTIASEAEESYQAVEFHEEGSLELEANAALQLRAIQA